jgi:acetyl/propionyl-CoA carboxylase alpha subunit
VRCSSTSRPGGRWQDLGLTQERIPAPRGFAIQARVNMETMGRTVRPGPPGGTLAAFEPPTGAGRAHGHLRLRRLQTSPRFDSLLAKVIAHSPADFPATAARAVRALAEFRIEGVETNVAFLQAILSHPEFLDARYSTGFIETHAEALLADAASQRRVQYAPPEGSGEPAAATVRRAGRSSTAPTRWPCSTTVPVAPPRRDVTRRRERTRDARGHRRGELGAAGHDREPRGIARR